MFACSLSSILFPLKGLNFEFCIKSLFSCFTETTNFYPTREMMLRRKLEEQAKLQQAIEFQRRRFLNLQLPDLKNHIHHHQRSLSVGSPVTLHSHDVNQNVILPCDGINQEILEGLC